MQGVHLLQILLTLNFLFPTFLAQKTPRVSLCGKIEIRSPFAPTNSLVVSPPLNHMILCKSQKLYFRTSLGLFPISSLDYTTKLLTISHKLSSSSNFISPSQLTAGFPSPPQPNSLKLFNCSKQTEPMLPFVQNCKGGPSFELHEQENGGSSSCLLVDDVGNLDMSFHPNNLNCSKYSRVYRNSSSGDHKNNVERFQLGTRISFDMPGHVPNPCDECEKAHGNCGVGLKCICHPKECKDKVISLGVKMNSFAASSY